MGHLLAAVVPVAERHLALLEPFNAAVGDGDPKYVAAQVIEHLLSLAGVLAVNDPVVFPDGWRYLVEPAELVESGVELAAKDFAQGKARDQEGGMAGRDPVLAILGESAGADQQMDVGMIKQGPGPGMQDGQHGQAS